MDWKLSIRKNREALAVVIAGLIGMITQAEALPSPVRRSITRILRPAESALRRLIVVVAAVQSQKAREKRSEDCENTEIQLPDFSTFATYDRLPAFALIDPRRKFDVVRRISSRDIPRIWVPGVFDRTPLPKPRETTDSAALLRRIRKLQYALATLPRQARRLNRLMKRNDQRPNPVLDALARSVRGILRVTKQNPATRSMKSCAIATGLRSTAASNRRDPPRHYISISLAVAGFADASAGPCASSNCTPVGLDRLMNAYEGSENIRLLIRGRGAAPEILARHYSAGAGAVTSARSRDLRKHAASRKNEMARMIPNSRIK
ncbi:MAG: hypothetical protein GY945_01990 [Rhodobacteraceae bacterium]|nr:hypothetical protein [Paracoccaceae bacterium]